MLFEDKCFNCPVRKIIESHLIKPVKYMYSAAGCEPVYLSCGGVYNPVVLNSGKSFEFYQSSFPCVLDSYTNQILTGIELQQYL